LNTFANASGSPTIALSRVLVSTLELTCTGCFGADGTTGDSGVDGGGGTGASAGGVFGPSVIATFSTVDCGEPPGSSLGRTAHGSGDSST
jgi:hypothetical protein